MSVSRWDAYSCAAIIAVLIFQVLSWKHFPLFIDCYYHLSVMRGFADAGGWVGVAFWEYAPYGRPHLYPPLFHILELAVFKAGFSPINVARLFDCLVFPAFLFSVWFVTRRLFSCVLAFFALFLLSSSYPLYLALTNNIPFTLAFLFGIFAFYFLQKGRNVSAALCLALSFYSHSLMPWIGFGALFLYGLLDSARRRRTLSVCLAGLVLAAPILYHQAKYAFFWHLTKVMEFFYYSVDPVLYLLALVGLCVVYRRKGPYLYFASLLVAMSFLLFTNRDRFLSGPGLIPAVFLAAAVLENFWQRAVSKKGRGVKALFFAVLALFFYVARPVLISTPFMKTPRLVVHSWVMERANTGTGVHQDKARTFYHPQLMDELVRLVRKHSGPEDIMYSNYSYGGGIVAALGHRATSRAMLHEVLPFDYVDPVADARLIVWFKEPSGAVSDDLPGIVERYRLTLAGETDLALVFLHETGEGRRGFVSARVPFWACLVFLGAAFALMTFGINSSKKS